MLSGVRRFPLGRMMTETVQMIVPNSAEKEKVLARGGKRLGETPKASALKRKGSAHGGQQERFGLANTAVRTR